MNKLQTFFSSLPLRWYLLGVGVVATLLRLISVTKASIWHDEGYTMMLISHGPLEIIARTARDFHPPLYYLVAHWWSLLFGTTELAIRSLSVACGVGIVILTYFIVKRLKFSETTARLATLLMAFAPFLVRYSEEARMYGMAAFMICAATLALLIAINYRGKSTRKQHLRWWLIYGALMAAALYTHYYVGFLIFVHIGYAWHSYGGFKALIKTPAWWAGNLVAAGGFALWIPTVIAQVTRVQGGYWIPPATAETIPNTLLQFVSFASNYLPSSIEMLLAVAFACYVTFVITRATKANRPQLWFVVAWAIVPLLIALLASLKQPVYYDRYFAYAAIGFYVLLAVLITNARTKQWIKQLLVAAVLLLFCVGIGNVAYQANHQMRTIGAYVNDHYQSGDMIVSAELYTYFDFSYYNHTDAPVHLLSSGDLSGYGETSLLYDTQEDIVVHSLNDIDGPSRVWLVGKPGDKAYYTTDVPADWQPLQHVSLGDSVVRLYQLD